MKKVSLSVCILALLISCGGKTDTIKAQSGEATSSIGADNKLDAQLEKELAEMAIEEERLEKERITNLTTLSFDKKRHDFGNVLPDTDNITEFVVTNTGNRPLIIEDVSASCGCTMPKKPKGPIAPGKSDVIEVKFHPKPGQKNEIVKTVTVTANTEQKVHKVEIRAFVTE